MRNIVYTYLVSFIQDIELNENHIFWGKWFSPIQLVTFLENDKFKQRSVCFQLIRLASQLDTLHHKTISIKNNKKRYVQQHLFLILRNVNNALSYPHYSPQLKRPNNCIIPTTTPTQNPNSNHTLFESTGHNLNKIDITNDILPIPEVDPLKQTGQTGQQATNTQNNQQHIQSPPQIKRSHLLSLESQWESPEALLLFTGISTRKTRKRSSTGNVRTTINVRNHIKNKIYKLKKAYLTYDGWRNIVDDRDSSNVCSTYDVFFLQQKARYLAVSLSLALELWNSLPFIDICQRAIDTIRLFDFPDGEEYENCSEEDDDDENNNRRRLFTIREPRTIMKWLRIFRRTSTFPNPSISRLGKRQVPIFFQNNPDLYTSFNAHVRSNLDTISSESIHQYLFQVAIPETIKQINLSNPNQSNPTTINSLLASSGLTKLSISTIKVWMRQLGFKYEERKKTYYVDTHEKIENVQYRANFITRYFLYELCAHRWIQMTKEESDRCKKDGIKFRTHGHEYNIDGVTYIEYHVDDHDILQDRCKHLTYGGNLSVRKPIDKKPIIIFGQDECIFKQYAFTKKSWTLPDGTKPLIPKDEGQGVMLSSFVSREFGYGMNLSDPVLSLINEYRENKSYSDCDAAIQKNGNSRKSVLTQSPFITELEYGANKEGYWTYECMSLQLEDCIDCMKVLYPQFDVVFLFDHSNGHDRLQPNGLSTTKVRKNFGGKQPKMRSSVLTDKNCFGPYHNASFKLQLNMTQSMVFTDSDDGPIQLDAASIESRRYDVDSGKIVNIKMKKSQLTEQLKKEGLPFQPGDTRKKLVAACVAHGLPVTYQESRIVEGWVGKAKGSLQILFERGWIDTNRLDCYTNKGIKDAMGIVLEDTSLNVLMQRQPDFLSELTLLQYHGKKLGVTIDRTPKCHPEMAGEGIEYAWALAKLFYRGQSISEKRTKDKFRNLVRLSTSRVDVLNLDRIRNCSKRAREYMFAYKAIQEIREECSEPPLGSSSTSSLTSSAFNEELIHMSYEIIEKSIKVYKTHRSCLDTDLKWVQNMNEKIGKKKVDAVKIVVLKMENMKYE
jgi:hypothetical protein